VFSWAEIGFAQFDFELIALTLGTYQTGDFPAGTALALLS
jgi:hypothetical protein